MIRKTVAILGSGPSALVAAHAAFLKGAYVSIFSKGEKSPLHGCQYLHAQIPEIGARVEKRTVNYTLFGSAEEYREKVYGDEYHGPVSVDSLTGFHSAWDLRRTYDRLWEIYMSPTGRATSYERTIANHDLSGGLGGDLQDFFDLTISTIPAPALCSAPLPHSFHSMDIWAIGDVKDGAEYISRAPFDPPDDTVVCNGDENPAWYRASRVFGVSTVEWPGRIKPPIPGVAAVSKPLGTNCNCFPWIKRMGRYGAWDKGILTHHVFEQTMELLDG